MSEERPTYEPAPIEPGTPSPGTGARLNSAKRLLLAFTSPGEVFADIDRKPTWAVAMLAMILLSLLAQVAVIGHLDMEATMRQTMEQRGTEVDDEQMERMIEGAERFKYLGMITPLVGVPLFFAAAAGIFFLGLKLTGSDADYPHTLSATLHSYWPPSVVATALLVVLVQRVGQVSQDALQEIVRSNLAAFLADDAPAWLRAAGQSLDVFNVWIVILLIIGFATVGRISRGRAAAVVLVPWGIFIVIKAALAAAFA